MSDSDPSARRPDPALARRVVLTFGCGSLLVVAILWGAGALSPSPRRPGAGRAGPGGASRAAYLGSRTCGDCHPGERAAHARSGHARTLRPAARSPLAGRLDGATFVDPESPGTRWSYRLRAGQLWTERSEGGEVERFLVDYAFGSGHHATTFVTLTDRTPDRPTMIEHRLTVFAHRQVPDITPGQGQARGPRTPGVGPSGRHYPSWSTLKCFECHTTTTSDRGPLVLDEAAMIPNVGCEQCHGPGRAHVEAARRGAGEASLAMPFGLGSWKGDEEIRMCGACHRLPEMGDSMAIRPENPGVVRFQPIGLMQSACYRKSRGALSCSTCHDPHARTSTDLATYEAVCLSCHGASSRSVCKLSRAQGCVDCHMPRRDVVRGMMMTDHWIRTRPAAPVNQPSVDGRSLPIEPSGVRNTGPW